MNAYPNLNKRQNEDKKSSAHAVLRQHNDARTPAIWVVVMSIAASESLWTLLAQTPHLTGKSEEPLPPGAAFRDSDAGLTAWGQNSPLMVCHLDRTSALQGLWSGDSAAECRAAVPQNRARVRKRPIVRMRVGRKGSQNTAAFVDESKTVCLAKRVIPIQR